MPLEDFRRPSRPDQADQADQLEQDQPERVFAFGYYYTDVRGGRVQRRRGNMWEHPDREKIIAEARATGGTGLSMDFPGHDGDASQSITNYGPGVRMEQWDSRDGRETRMFFPDGRSEILEIIQDVGAAVE